MAVLFNVSIKNPEKRIYEGRISSLIAPGKEGYLGILANHAPLITELAAGKISLRDDSGKVIDINSEVGGLLEVSNNNAVLLLD